jgi:hypothetical protein
MKKNSSFLILVGALLFFTSVSQADDDADLERIFPRRHGGEINKIELSAGGSVRGWVKVNDSYKRTEITCGKHATKLVCELVSTQRPETTIKGYPAGFTTMVTLKIGGNVVHSEVMNPDGVKKVQAKLEEYRATGICLPEITESPVER